MKQKNKLSTPKVLLISLQKFGGGAIDSLEMSNALMENKFSSLYFDF